MPEDAPTQLLARRLRSAREQSGLSQEVVASRLGLKRPAISEIEAGRRRVRADELALLSELYNVSMQWLTTESNDNSTKLEIAARGLSKLRDDDLDKILELLNSLRAPDSKP
ncbi:helix-turn-helix transcriptional regulator [Verrucomicrobium sp. BvORR034]|uniref:helix-turn-helix domain-containing protein n=1 Tax=Verrucomicrobium sp. BvORR034 TaxID=1396418 RepID=UPI0009DEAE7A|nr:helix-turn-helix transcriptional regulator [Verrucomicrobium sp. BvORR034]